MKQDNNLQSNSMKYENIAPIGQAQLQHLGKVCSVLSYVHMFHENAYAHRLEK